MRATRWTSPSTPPPPRFSLLRPFVLILLLSALLAGTGAAAPGGRDQVKTIAEALERNRQAGDYDMCRSLLRELMRLRPADPRLHYNLACIETLDGDGHAAIEALQRAVDMGWTDVRTLEADPDLASLRRTQAYKDFVGGIVRELLSFTMARITRLEDGPWHDIGLLAETGGDRVIRLETKFDDEGFGLRARGPAGILRPEGRDAELLVTIAAPDSFRSFDTRRAWRFGFGVRDGRPHGQLLGLPGRPLRQPVVELAPEFEPGRDADELVLVARVPWSYLAPYAPPADVLFGVNAGYSGPGRFAQLVRDPAMSDPDAEWHRYLPVRLGLDDDSTPRLSGRLANALVGTRPVEMELVAWCGAAGAHVLTTDVLDEDGRSVVSSGGGAETVDLQAGRNVLVRRADLSALPEGAYELAATLTPADGEPMAWRVRVLRLRGDWLYQARDRAKALLPAEQASLLWRLDLVSEELKRRDVRSFPTALHTTLTDIETMFERHAEAGTVLPATGHGVLLCPVGMDRAVQQTLYLAADWEEAADAPVLVLLEAGGRHAPGLGAELADRLGETPGTVVVVPQLPSRQPGRWDEGTREAAEAVMDWLGRRFPERPFRLAALDDSPDAGDLANLRLGAPSDARWIAPGEGAIDECLAWIRVR